MPTDPSQPLRSTPATPAASQAEKDERKLDEALESTFPASDPVAAETPKR